MRTDRSSATGIQIALPRLQFLCLQSGTEQSPCEHEADCFKLHTSYWMVLEPTSPGGVEPKLGRFQSSLPPK